MEKLSEEILLLRKAVFIQNKTCHPFAVILIDIIFSLPVCIQVVWLRSLVFDREDEKHLLFYHLSVILVSSLAKKS